MRQINRYTATSPAVHLKLSPSNHDHDRPSPSHSPEGSSLGTLPPPPPPAPKPAQPPTEPPQWHQSIPELADALPAADDDDENDGDEDENEYTLLDYMRFLAPRQHAVEVALEKMVAGEARRVTRRVEEWARAVEIW